MSTAGWMRTMPALAWAAVIWLLSSTPSDGMSWLDGPWLGLPFLDKLAHAGLFGILAALLLYARATPSLAIALATLWGVIDEIHQRFVPGRFPDGWDVAADVVGAVVAVLAVRSLASWRQRARYPDRSGRRSES